jgi:GAF domain-containing protein
MDRADNLLAELLRLASLPDPQGDQDAHLHELTSAAARLLRARSSTFLWLSEEHCAPDPEATLGHALCSAIRSGGRAVALLHVSGPIDKPRFDGDDLRLLELIAVYIGKSLQVAQLQNVLNSRFAQIALAHSVENTVGEVLAAVHHPAAIVRILAKSFYREMTRMGFGTNDVINAASQIISELSVSLKRHARRRGANPVESRR